MINGIYKNDEEFFKAVIDFINNLCEKNDDCGLNSYILQNKILNLLLALRGFDKLPKVISDDEFEKMNSDVIYRGAGSIEHHANTLCDFSYHKGQGAGMDGLYFTHRPEIAIGYTHNNIQNKDELILKAKIDPKAKVVSVEKLINIIRNRSKNKKYELLKSIINQDENHAFDLSLLFEYDFAILATTLGYDVVLYDDSVIVLNRSKVNVSKSEFDRIVSKSKYYNLDGTINFEKKYEDDYFPDV